MKVQTERVENHHARVSVEIEPERLDTAKRQAARRISREVSIRGFRKGKAPYSRVALTVGEVTILEEAVNALARTLFKELDGKVDYKPFGPVEFEDFQLEPAPTFIYLVPMAPEVDLGDYRELRLDFTPPDFDDSEIDDELRKLQGSLTLVVDDEKTVVELGDRVHIDMLSEFADDPDTQDPKTETDEIGDGDTDSAHDAPSAKPQKGDTFVNEKDIIATLDPDDDRFIHGWVEHLLGAELGMDVEFELQVPDDDEDEEVRGRLLYFAVTINQIEEIDIPEIDDSLAESVSEDLGLETNDLPGLRAHLRAQLEADALDSADQDYAERVLEEITAAADIQYPSQALEERIDQNVRKQLSHFELPGGDIDTVLRVLGTTMEEIREQHREAAEAELRREYVLEQLSQELGTELSDEDIDAWRDTFAASFGLDPTEPNTNTPQMRKYFERQRQAEFLQSKLVALGRGQDMDAAMAAKRARAQQDVQRAQVRRKWSAAARGEHPDAMTAIFGRKDAASALLSLMSENLG